MSKIKENQIWRYIQDYRFNSILVKNFLLIFGLFFLVLTAITGIVSYTMNDIIEEEVGNMSINSLGKTRDRIDVVMEEAVRISGQLSLDEDIRLFMLSTKSDALRNNLINNVRNKIKMYSGVFNYIDTIYVYSTKRQYVVSNMDSGNVTEYGDLTWYHNFTERINEPARTLVRLKKGVYPYLISYILPMRLSQLQFLGGIIVNIDAEKLEELVITKTKNVTDNILIVDDKNNIIFSTDHSLLTEKINEVDFYKDINLKSGDSYKIMNDGVCEQLVATVSSNNYPWKFISVIPLSAFKERRNRMTGFYIHLILFSILIAAIVSIILSLHSYDPLKNILSLLKNPNLSDERGEWTNEFRKDESKEIVLNIVRTLYSNVQLQKEITDYMRMIDKAQITALQAQISPHFLYNTLENIRWMAMDIFRGDNSVSQAILNLSGLLRLSLENDQQLITIEEEIKNAKLYIEILQVRYKDRLEVIWDVDESTLMCPIVKISFQPVIENAVYHGLKPLRKKGIIYIVIRKEESAVVVKIIDNGAGMSNGQVEKLNTDMSEKNHLNGEHIGIYNVNQRLKLLLGEEYGIEVNSEEQNGTMVVFRLPLN